MLQLSWLQLVPQLATAAPGLVLMMLIMRTMTKIVFKVFSWCFWFLKVFSLVFKDSHGFHGISRSFFVFFKLFLMVFQSSFMFSRFSWFSKVFSWLFKVFSWFSCFLRVCKVFQDLLCLLQCTNTFVIVLAFFGPTNNFCQFRAEVEFVNAVTAGGGVKFLPAV